MTRNSTRDRKTRETDVDVDLQDILCFNAPSPPLPPQDTLCFNANTPKNIPKMTHRPCIIPKHAEKNSKSSI